MNLLDVHILEQWQSFAAILILMIFYVWESILPFMKQKKFRSRHAIRNLSIAGINLFVLVFLFSGIIQSISVFTENNNLGILNWINIPQITKALAAIIILDFWTYWWHRFNHIIPFLWRFHRVHHSDTEMDVTTATRFHLGEVVISSTLRLLLIPLIGIPIWSLIFYDMILLISTQFHHANIGLNYSVDRFIQLFFVSPFMHKIHHSNIEIETNSNFTSLFSLWDRVFGTYKKRTDYSKFDFGLKEFTEDKFQTVIGIFKTPFNKLN